MNGFETAQEHRACLAIVRRGDLDLYWTLKVRLEEPDVVEVIWDRRINERRTAIEWSHQPERRRRSRRGPPSDIWSTFGFVVAAQAPK